MSSELTISPIYSQKWDYKKYDLVFAKLDFLGRCRSMANKADLIDKVASKSGLTKKDATAAVESLFDTVTETLSEGERVQIIGFGSFEVRDRAARKGRNPQTGEEIEIPATKVPAFKAGKGLKDAVKENA